MPRAWRAGVAGVGFSLRLGRSYVDEQANFAMGVLAGRWKLCSFRRNGLRLGFRGRTVVSLRDGLITTSAQGEAALLWCVSLHTHTEKPQVVS